MVRNDTHNMVANKKIRFYNKCWGQAMSLAP